jgi:hypothetical protein
LAKIAKKLIITLIPGIMRDPYESLWRSSADHRTVIFKNTTGVEGGQTATDVLRIKKNIILALKNAEA